MHHLASSNQSSWGGLTDKWPCLTAGRMSLCFSFHTLKDGCAQRLAPTQSLSELSCRSLWLRSIFISGQRIGKVCPLALDFLSSAKILTWKPVCVFSYTTGFLLLKRICVSRKEVSLYVTVSVMETWSLTARHLALERRVCRTPCEGLMIHGCACALDSAKFCSATGAVVVDENKMPLLSANPMRRLLLELS